MDCLLYTSCPVDWNETEGRYNWELVFCELYAGGKYKNGDGDNYEYSLGLNGLGSCATPVSYTHLATSTRMPLSPSTPLRPSLPSTGR